MARRWRKRPDTWPIPSTSHRAKDYDVLWQTRKPGKWLIHCHISHHMTNNNVETDGGGGLMVVIDVATEEAG